VVDGPGVMADGIAVDEDLPRSLVELGGEDTDDLVAAHREAVLVAPGNRAGQSRTHRIERLIGPAQDGDLAVPRDGERRGDGLGVVDVEALQAYRLGHTRTLSGPEAGF
jgi:hypothetical protein